MRKLRDCSVALSYIFGDSIPVITASGRGAVAQRMREIAKEYRIPLINEPVLAEVLVKAEIGSCIPEETYQAVAAIFAFIQKKNEVYRATTD